MSDLKNSIKTAGLIGSFGEAVCPNGISAQCLFICVSSRFGGCDSCSSGCDTGCTSGCKSGRSHGS